MAENFSVLFEAYSSYYENSLMTDEQNQHLRMFWCAVPQGEITLSQADEWMNQAGLIRKKSLSVTDTGFTFAKFK